MQHKFTSQMWPPQVTSWLNFRNVDVLIDCAAKKLHVFYLIHSHTNKTLSKNVLQPSGKNKITSPVVKNRYGSPLGENRSIVSICRVEGVAENWDLFLYPFLRAQMERSANNQTTRVNCTFPILNEKKTALRKID